MRKPDEAIAEILGHVEPLRELQSVDLDLALGRVLGEPVESDVDLPPFEKSAMDGYAVRSADLGPGSPGKLRCKSESRAGAPFSGSVAPGECVAIYTGAELPEDCDAVVMIEDTSIAADEVTFRGEVRARQNICARAEDLACGQRVLEAGRRLSAVDISVLAAVGCDPVPAVRRPRVGVLTTGDELVPPRERPGRGQIREGNTYHLAALARQCGALADNLGSVRDDPEQLTATFRATLERSDAVITTGGVSAGRYDLVGQAFERIGVRPVFHKVAIKPGKPIWFGCFGAVPVFALPGNPVSCLVGFEIFVRPALAKLGGVAEAEWFPPLRSGLWAGGSVRTNARQQHLPVRVEAGDDGLDRLHALAWKGSADVVSLTRADGLALIEADQSVEVGQLVRYRCLPTANHAVDSPSRAGR